MHKFAWDNASTQTKAEAKAAKQLQDNAKKYKENLEVGRADITGFGAGGYWDQNSKTYGEKNPADAHKYARGAGGVGDYDKGMAHALGGRGKTTTPSAALGAKETQINQKLDEIVNGQNLSESKQAKMQEDLQKLNAEKNVIVWQQQNPQATEEDFDSKKDSFGEKINRVAENPGLAILANR